MYTVLESIVTKNPPFKFRQSDFAKFMSRVEKIPKSLRKRMNQIYSLSGIDYRYSCLEDYGREPENFRFYPQNWSLSPFPTTEKRNQKYQTSVVDLAVNASKQALDRANINSEKITHLIVVSCTGFFCPGLDIHLVKQLKLKLTINRTIIGFMGCHAALNALKIAHSICQTESDARVLLVCAELCTLHFQFDTTIENTATNSLFSDGVGAAILASQSFEAAKGKLAYLDGSSLLDKDSLEHLTWNIGNTGFLIGLSRQVPELIADRLPSYLNTFLDRHGLSLKELDFWAIHPGGKRIIEQIQLVLELTDEKVADSFEILRLYGNMSSATILFVLKRILDRHQANLKQKNKGYQKGIALAFGPGVSLESCLWQKVE
jgi:alpha-pyrone synthase